MKTFPFIFIITLCIQLATANNIKPIYKLGSNIESKQRLIAIPSQRTIHLHAQKSIKYEDTETSMAFDMTMEVPVSGHRIPNRENEILICVDDCTWLLSQVQLMQKDECCFYEVHENVVASSEIKAPQIYSFKYIKSKNESLTNT